MEDAKVVPPRGVRVIRCISIAFAYAVYDRATDEMLGYAESQQPRVGRLLDVTHNARCQEHGTPFAVAVVELDERAWD